MHARPRAIRIAWIGALLLCAALLIAPWRGHVDDFDAQIYLVVVRNMVRDHTGFDLSYLPAFNPVFREHLPFGFWPAAAALRLAGEWAIDPVYAAMTLGAIAVSGLIARRLAGEWAGISAVVLLGTCESIWQYGGRLLLEPPLLLFATAAAGAALYDLWLAAAVLGAVATLIKGPFGLLPLACVCLVKARNWRAIAAVLAAVVPLGIFLLVDPSGGWREGYLRHQILASATGVRTDGVSAFWHLPAVIARRFWPGLPFLVAGFWRARRSPELRPIALACALMVALLCLPFRKWGNHAYVSFPLLAALAGAAAAPLWARLRQPHLAVAGLALAALIFSGSGLGARVLQPPCPFSTVLGDALRSLPPGKPVLMVSPSGIWPAVAQVAAETGLLPTPVSTLSGRDSAPGALSRGVAIPQGWQVLGTGAGWSVLRRAVPPAGPAPDGTEFRSGGNPSIPARRAPGEAGIHWP
jgi:4-amino-4-deoxy-L-arabinose transferase-like glycosyltransferase